MPAVTFLMTTYNGGEFLRPAIESALAQTERDFRMLVIDDASTDGSAAVARSYDDPRLEVVALEDNIGQTAALNLGLSRIDTPWVARLDQDDLAAPARLERQLAYIERHPRTVLVGALTDLIDGQGRVVGRYRPATEPHEVVLELFARSCPIVHSAVTYRRAAVQQAGGYDPRFRYAQDLALWIRLSEYGELANVPEVLTALRVHPDQTSRAPSISAIQFGEMLEITRELPPHVRLTPREQALWRARRTRLELERSVVALRAGDRTLARESAGRGLRSLARNPASLGSLVRLAGMAATRRIAGRRRPG